MTKLEHAQGRMKSSEHTSSGKNRIGSRKANWVFAKFGANGGDNGFTAVRMRAKKRATFRRVLANPPPYLHLVMSSSSSSAKKKKSDH